MDRGVLILALGHYYYGCMAANLAISIKKVSPNMPIHLVSHGQALAYVQDKMRFFDSHEVINEDYIKINGDVKYFKAKTHIYDLSPFQETIYLDADMVWCRQPVENAFNELSAVDFTIANRGEEVISDTTKWLWGNPQDFKQFGAILPNYHSEFVYFKKCERIKAYFDLVKETYLNPPIPHKQFAGHIADEFAFTIASVKMDVRPHKVPYVPTYWMFVDKSKFGINFETIFNNFYCFSVGGAAYSKQMKDYYDKAVKANAQIMNAGQVWQLKPKRSYLAERHTL